MSNEPTLSATLPPGTYVVGDPCYSIPDDKWMAWLEASNYTIGGREHVLVAEVDGRLCVGVSTAYGDGAYEDQRGNYYGVDAGLIGLVPVEVAGKNSMGDSRVVMTFDEEVVCFYDDGTINLGPVLIETGDPESVCDNCGDTVDGGSDLCWSCEEDESWECEDCGTETEYGEYVCGDCAEGRATEDGE